MALKKQAYASLPPGLLVRIQISWEGAWYMAGDLPGTWQVLCLAQRGATDVCWMDG